MTGTSTFSTSTAYCGLLNFLHARGYDLRLFPGVFNSLFVHALFVSHEFQKERNVRCHALRANALDPGMLDVIDLRRIERGVVQKNLDAIGAIGHQASHGIVIEQIGQASRLRVVVATILICQQEACILRALFGSRETVFRIEQDRACVRRENRPHLLHVRDGRAWRRRP